MNDRTTAIGGNRELRAARNEVLFREINERLNDPDAALSMSEICVCECADETCTAPIEVSPAAYEAVRSQGERFVIAPGHHVYPEVERVVERHVTYEVVEKLREAAAYARGHDP